MFQFSRRLAYVFGIALPILETVRRFSQLDDLAVWPLWLDDFLIGAVLLIGARLTADHRYSNTRYLAAAWAFACGMAYPSFFAEILHLDLPDPAPIPTAWVAAIKGLGFMLAIAALIGALKPPANAPAMGVASAPLASMPPSAAEALARNPDRLEQMLDPTDDA